MEPYRWQRVHIDPKETKDVHENRSLHKSGDQHFTRRVECQEFGGPQAGKSQTERHQGQWAWRRSGERDDQDSAFRKIYTIEECSQFAKGSGTGSLAESRSEPKKGIENCNAIAFTRVMSKWSAWCVMMLMDKVKKRKTWSRHVGGEDKLSTSSGVDDKSITKAFGMIAILLRKMSGLTVKVMFECVESSFEFHRRLRQGIVEAPQLWQIMTAQLFASVEARWTQKRWVSCWISKEGRRIRFAVLCGPTTSRLCPIPEEICLSNWRCGWDLVRNFQNLWRMNTCGEGERSETLLAWSWCTMSCWRKNNARFWDIRWKHMGRLLMRKECSLPRKSIRGTFWSVPYVCCVFLLGSENSSWIIQTVDIMKRWKQTMMRLFLSRRGKDEILVEFRTRCCKAVRKLKEQMDEPFLHKINEHRNGYMITGLMQSWFLEVSLQVSPGGNRNGNDTVQEMSGTTSSRRWMLMVDCISKERTNQVICGWFLFLSHFLRDLGPWSVGPSTRGSARAARSSPRFNQSVLDFGPQRLLALNRKPQNPKPQTLNSHPPAWALPTLLRDNARSMIIWQWRCPISRGMDSLGSMVPAIQWYSHLHWGTAHWYSIRRVIP